MCRIRHFSCISALFYFTKLNKKLHSKGEQNESLKKTKAGPLWKLCLLSITQLIIRTIALYKSVINGKFHLKADNLLTTSTLTSMFLLRLQ